MASESETCQSLDLQFTQESKFYKLTDAQTEEESGFQ